MHAHPVEYTVHSGNCWTEIHQYRIKDLQKIVNKLLLVLQVKARLRGSQEELLIEFKLNADYPLVSAYLHEFRNWITAEQLPGHGRILGYNDSRGLE